VPTSYAAGPGCGKGQLDTLRPRDARARGLFRLWSAGWTLRQVLYLGSGQPELRSIGLPSRDSVEVCYLAYFSPHPNLVPCRFRRTVRLVILSAFSSYCSACFETLNSADEGGVSEHLTSASVETDCSFVVLLGLLCEQLLTELAQVQVLHH
jgi:hypothetical protein